MRIIDNRAEAVMERQREDENVRRPCPFMDSIERAGSVEAWRREVNYEIRKACLWQLSTNGWGLMDNDGYEAEYGEGL